MSRIATTSSGVAREALHDEHITEHIARALADLVVQLLDFALLRVSAAHRDRIERREAQHEADHQQRELPVDRERERNHDEDRQQRCKVLAEEAEPEPEQVAAAVVHDAQQPARVMLAVERERQCDRMLEELRDRGLAATMRESVRIERNPDARDDAAEADRGPRS